MIPTEEPWEKAARLLFDAAEIMVPVITGYLILVVGSVGKIWEKRNELPRIRWKLLIHSLLLGIGSLGFWIGVLPSCIMATYKHSEGYFNLGQWVARLGTLQLFSAFVCYGCFFFLTFWPLTKESGKSTSLQA